MNKYVIRRIMVLLILIAIVITIITSIVNLIKSIFTKDGDMPQNNNINNTVNQINNNSIVSNEVTIPISSQPKEYEITDWRLTLVNSDNVLPEDFEVELADIDEDRQFDSRAIKELNKMMNDMRKAGITNVWVQSSYRSVKKQKQLFENSVLKYMKQGKSREKAEELTEQLINRPGSSEHNLGLAVDFNKVENEFKNTKGYKWLIKNAENYGFILRYPEDKVEITGISYEPWHWRYVGEEYAKEINKLDMCLEEYIEYLKIKLANEI